MRIALGITLFVLVGHSAHQAKAQEYSEISLNESWLTVKEGKHQPFNKSDKVKTIHFQLADSLLRGGFVVVKSQMPFNLFINGSLGCAAKRQITLNIDSVNRKYRIPVFSINSAFQINPKSLSTTIIFPSNRRNQEDLGLRIDNESSNFFTISSIILFAAFSLLFRSNPQLMVDYLNPIKFFSLKEKAENSTTNRVTSSFNILFYLFISFFISLLLLLILRGTSISNVGILNLEFRTVADGIVKWISISLLVIMSLLIKLLMILSLSSAYKLKGALYLHFNNFIRLLAILTFISALFPLTLFILKWPLAPYLHSFFLFGIIFLAGWMIITYLKLLANTRFHFFHLFSYLCVTEFIPFILIIKIIF